MSGSWDQSANQYINMSAGGAAAAGSGAFTIALLWMSADALVGNFDAGLCSLLTTTTLRRSFIVADNPGHLFGGNTNNDFSSGFGTIAFGTWYVSAVTKPSGSAHNRFHLWPYAADGSGTMSHGEATGAANFTDAGAINQFHIGDVGTTKGSGLIAVVGLWTSALSDANLDTLKSADLTAWAALSPAALISLENWDGTTGATDVVGTSSQTALVGTVGVGADPPSFDFTLGGGGTDHAGAVAPTVTATFTPVAHRIRPGAISAAAVATLAPTPHQGRHAAITSTVTATLTPAPVHIRPAAIAATAAATLTPAAVHTRPAAITATAEAELLLTVGGQNQAAASGTATAALTLATAHTRAAAVSLTAVASMVSTASKTGTHAITAGVLARMIATITSAIMRDITVTYGPPELAWSFGPPETTWRFGPPET